MLNYNIHSLQNYTELSRLNNVDPSNSQHLHYPVYEHITRIYQPLNKYEMHLEQFHNWKKLISKYKLRSHCNTSHALLYT